MFYLIEVSDTTSGVAKAIYDKSTLDDATIQLHQTLASAMSSENVNSCLVMIIDRTGAVQRHEFWERTV